MPENNSILKNMHTETASPSDPNEPEIPISLKKAFDDHIECSDDDAEVEILSIACTLLDLSDPVFRDDSERLRWVVLHAQSQYEVNHSRVVYENDVPIAHGGF